MSFLSDKQPSILIAGNFHFCSTTSGLAHGFGKLGWQVYTVDSRDHLNAGQSFAGKVFARLRYPRNVKSFNQAILNCATEKHPTGFLTVKGGNISGETLEKLGRLGLTRVNYYPDCHFNFKNVDERVFSAYDHFFTTKSFQVDYLQKCLGAEKVSFLHHGYVPAVHQPPVNDSLAHLGADVLYIGNYTQAKATWLCHLKERFPDISLKIYGNRWECSENKQFLGSSLIGRPLYGEEFAAAIHFSKINIAVHMGVVDDSGWEDLVSTRTFEIPACKGFMLHIDNPEVRQLYTVGEEIDVFIDVDDLCEKVKFYLMHEDIRTQIAARGYQRCAPAYSYDARAKMIEDVFLQSGRTS